jgi:hypothetical protein
VSLFSSSKESVEDAKKRAWEEFGKNNSSKIRKCSGKSKRKKKTRQIDAEEFRRKRSS